jgi:hypothetical protein
VGAIEGAEDLLRRTDRVLERRCVGGAGVLIQPHLYADRPVPAVSLERRELSTVRHRPRSQRLPFHQERANAPTEGSVPPFGEQQRQRQRQHQHRAGDVGPIELWASAGNNGAQRIVFVGAIGDYGTALNVNKNGKPNPNGNYVKVTLKKGTFMIDVTAMNKAINSQQDPQVGSHATCSAAFSGSAPVTFLNGRGLYKGHGNRTIHPCDPTQPATCRRS